MLILLGVVAGAVVVMTRRDPPLRYRRSVFREPDPGIILVRFPDAAYVSSDVDWVGRRPVVAVRVVAAGRQGSTQRETLALIDVENRRVYELRRPAPAPALGKTTLFTQTYVPETPRTSRLHDCLLVSAPANEGPSGTPCVHLLAQKWNAAKPKRKPVFSSDPLGARPDDARYYPGTCLGAAVNPADGCTVCLTLAARETSTLQFLAERDIRWEGPGDISSRITTRGAPITAARYSPDGSRIAYLRAKSTGGTELWVVRSGGAEVAGAKLVEGLLTACSFAFSPDSRCIVVSLPTAGAPDNLLKLIELAGAPPRITDIGQGRISRAPWHPSGEFLLTMTEDTEGLDQLWAVRATPPYDRRQLTQLCLDEEPAPDRKERPAGPAVSRDGQWAAARLAPQSPNTLVLLDLDRLMRQPRHGDVTLPPGAPAQSGRPD